MQGSVISKVTILSFFKDLQLMQFTPPGQLKDLTTYFKRQRSKVNLTIKEKYVISKTISKTATKKILHDNIGVDTDTITWNTQKHTVIDNEDWLDQRLPSLDLKCESKVFTFDKDLYIGKYFGKKASPDLINSTSKKSMEKFRLKINDNLLNVFVFLRFLRLQWNTLFHHNVGQNLTKQILWFWFWHSYQCYQKWSFKH